MNHIYADQSRHIFYQLSLVININITVQKHVFYQKSAIIAHTNTNNLSVNFVAECTLYYQEEN